MAEKKKGYAPIWRDIQDNWLWQSDDPFDIRSAWIDLILSVNVKKKKLKVGCNIIYIHPGQIWTSYRKLAQKWHWSIARVKRYTDLLKSDGMIYVDATSNGTLLTLVNYDNFAIRGNTDKHTDEYTDEYTGRTQTKRSRNADELQLNNEENDKRMEIHERERKEIEPAPPVGGGEWQ